jgi:hypothetical protein
VPRLWLFCPIILMACTDAPIRSGTTSERSEPQLLIRCEGGRLGAYMVVATPAELESGEADLRAVPVKLDSVLSC